MKNQHVVPHSKGWAVKTEGASKGRVFESQKEAISAATNSAKKQSGEVFIHNKEGRIRERNSYGHDPYPPKG